MGSAQSKELSREPEGFPEPVGFGKAGLSVDAADDPGGQGFSRRFAAELAPCARPSALWPIQFA